MTKFTAYLTPDEPRADVMSAEEFNSILDRLGLSQAAAARLLNVNERTVRRWAGGENPALPTAAQFLRFLDRGKISPIKVMETLAS